MQIYALALFVLAGLGLMTLGMAFVVYLLVFFVLLCLALIFLTFYSQDPELELTNQTIRLVITMIRDIEERISCIAYTIVQLLKNNVPVGLKINGRLYPPDTTNVHKLNMLKELAIYEKNDVPVSIMSA
jgi:hypothetical protein